MKKEDKQTAKELWLACNLQLKKLSKAKSINANHPQKNSRNCEDYFEIAIFSLKAYKEQVIDSKCKLDNAGIQANLYVHNQGKLNWTISESILYFFISHFISSLNRMRTAYSY